MLLQALNRYYDILAEDQTSGIPRRGYSIGSVSYCLNIDEDGNLINIVPLKRPDEKGKKEVPVSMMLPERVTRTGKGYIPNFLCDNASYVLGIEKGNTERGIGKFESFKELNKTVLSGTDNTEARALLAFLEKWDVPSAEHNPMFADYLEDFYAGTNFVFRISGKENFVHENSEIRRVWEKYKNSGGAEEAVCLVKGERLPIARLHPDIKGIYGGQPMGNKLVSFNDSAYESYGKEKARGMNAPVSEEAAFAYGTVLNKLLSDKAHKISLGDSTIVFWAESPELVYADMEAMIFEADETAAESGNYVRDEAAVEEVRGIFQKIAEGKKPKLSNRLDGSVRFYILGLSPNAARISVRFFLSGTFSEMIDNAVRHYEDMHIGKQFPNEPNVIPLWQLLKETVNPNSKDKSSSPLLTGAVVRSIMSGTPYPATMLQSILLRVRADKKINYGRASMIKGYLTRCSNNEKYKEVLTVALNENSENKAYVLGRLFAVLEKIQLDSSDSSINTTMKDKYFTSACANPSAIFPLILKLSEAHKSKIAKKNPGFAVNNEKLLGSLFEKIYMDNGEKPFPSALSLEEQGIFILGYYHQRNSFYTSKKTEE